MEIEELAEEAIDWSKGDKYIELVRELKLNLISKTDECELLKVKIDDDERIIRDLNQELNQYKMMVLEINEDSKKNQEEFEKSRKLEEKCIKLMGDFMKLGEEGEQFKQTILDRYIAKSNTINYIECLYNSGAINHDLERLKMDLDKMSADLNLANSRCRNLEEESSTKEKCINDLRKTLDDAKVTHKHEIDVLGEYIQSLKNTINSYERTLASICQPQNKLSVSHEADT